MLPHHNPNHGSQMFVNGCEHPFHVPKSEVVYPSPYGLVQPLNPVVHRYAPASATKLLQLVLELGDRLFMRFGPPFLVAERVVIECVSEKLKFVRSTYVRLFSIDLEAQLPFNEGCDRVHDPLGTGLASDSNDHVVCISAEMQSPCLKFLVQLVEHDVRK